MKLHDSLIILDVQMFDDELSPGGQNLVELREGTCAYGARSTTVLPFRSWETCMANPHEFLESWVRKNVQATPHRNRAEARRLVYECRKAAEGANLSWFAVVKAAGGDVQGYVLTELNRAADQEAERFS